MFGWASHGDDPQANPTGNEWLSRPMTGIGKCRTVCMRVCVCAMV